MWLLVQFRYMIPNYLCIDVCDLLQQDAEPGGFREPFHRTSSTGPGLSLHSGTYALLPHCIIFFWSLYYHRFWGSVGRRGLQGDVIYLGWPIASSYMSPNPGGGWWVSGAQPMSTAVYRSPNKLWRSFSRFNLWLAGWWSTRTIWLLMPLTNCQLGATVKDSHVHCVWNVRWTCGPSYVWSYVVDT